MTIRNTISAGDIRILVVGDGQPANRITAQLFKDKFDVIQTPLLHSESDNVERHMEVLSAFNPQLVVIAHYVDRKWMVENDTPAARALMIDLVKSWATACKKRNTHIIHLSYGTVVAGYSNGPVTEDMEPKPTDMLGKLYAESERVFQEEAGEHAISFRIATPLDFGAPSLIDYVIDYARRYGLAVMPDEPEMSVVSSETIAEAVRAVAIRWPGSGIYHVADDEPATPRAIAKRFFVSPPERAAEPIAPYMRPVIPREKAFLLDTGKLRTSTSFTPLSWRG